MGGGHAHPLYRDGSSVVHRLPAEVKIVVLLVFVLAVVATPREAFWPFGVYAMIVLTAWRLARISLGWILPRMLIEVPFLVLAVLLPLTDGGERTQVAGLSLSTTGLYAAWESSSKARWGCRIVDVGSDHAGARVAPRTVPAGVPALVTSVLVLMVRYIDVLGAEVSRMRMARLSRRLPTHPSPGRAIAKSVGTLFLRSYERGERVYLAMLSRGYDGAVPGAALGPGGAARASVGTWAVALLPAVAAVGVAASVWIWR